MRRVTVREDSPTALAAYAAVRAEMATRGVELQLVDAAAATSRPARSVAAAPGASPPPPSEARRRAAARPS